MANQTITGTNENYDSAAIAGLLNGESITINGGSLTINSDVRWNQQAAVFGTITCSATLGGSVLFDGTQVWELYFNASTGNVPAQGALGANGVLGGTSAATGELLRVWATGALDPSAAGGAMPANGWIKLRSKVGNFQAGEVVTLPGGATITITGAGRRSWIHVVGRESVTITLSKLNESSMTGDWYELGTTNGLDDQTFQFPVADYCPAIQIETAVGSNQYEWWLHAPEGLRWGTATQYVATDVRGKYFGINPATGVITIARRATNACGFKPIAGLKVRIPNIICSSAPITNYAINSFNSTVIPNRFRWFLGTNNPNIYIDKVCSNWYFQPTSPNNVTITNSALMPYVYVLQGTGTITYDNLGIGCTPFVYSINIGMQIAQCVTAVSVSNVRIGVVAGPADSSSTTNISNCYNITFTNVQLEIFGATTSVDRAFATYTLLTSRCGAMTVNNLTMIGGGALLNTHLEPVTVTDIKYADKLNGTTNATIPLSALAISTSPKLKVSGPFEWFGGLSGVACYSTLISFASGSADCIVENIGTAAAPLDFQNITDRLVSISSSKKTIIRRCYSQNVRNNNFVVVTIDCTETVVDNCATDYTDTQQLLGTNSKFRGIKATLSAGALTAISGSEFMDLFTSATTGQVVFVANSPTAISGTDIVTVLGPNANFTGSGSLVMPNVNDSVTWTMSYFALGHTALQNTTPSFIGTNPANFTIEFQYDTGSGFNGTWLAATGANLSGIGAINPATGIKLKVRATVNTASATNAISFLRIDTTTTATDQNTLYPFPFDGIGVIENIVAGSRIQIYNEDTSTELANVIMTGTTYTYSYYVGTQISVGDSIRIRVTKLGCIPQTLIAIATSTGFSAAGNQSADVIYNSNGIDGSSVTEFTADFPNVEVDVSDPDNVTTPQRIYAWMRYIETTEDGIRLWFNAISANDEVNYVIDQSIADIKLDNLSATPVQIIGARLYRLDQSTVIAAASNSIQMDPDRVYSIGGSAADIWDYPTASATTAGSVGEQVAKKLLTTNSFLALKD